LQDVFIQKEFIKENHSDSFDPTQGITKVKNDTEHYVVKSLPITNYKKITKINNQFHYNKIWDLMDVKHILPSHWAKTLGSLEIHELHEVHH